MVPRGRNKIVYLNRERETDKDSVFFLNNGNVGFLGRKFAEAFGDFTINTLAEAAHERDRREMCVPFSSQSTSGNGV